nr:MAG TPA: hypothetical protein [Caudoviricetes sp.]
MIILSLKELLDEMYTIEMVLDSLSDSKKFYTNGLVNGLSEKNRVCHDAIDNIDKTIEMVHQHIPGFDAISSILYAIDNWNYPNTKLIEGYSRKRKELGNALSASVHGIFDMYNRDNVYLRSFIFALEKYTTSIEDFDKVSYDDSNDMTMIKNFNNVEELDIEKAQNVSKILSITNRLFKYYGEALKML